MKDSVNKQRVTSDFVSREVYANVNSMVEFILNHEALDAPFTLDDVTNMFKLPEYYGVFANFPSGSTQERDDEIERLEDLFPDANDEDQQTIAEEIDDLKELEEEPQKVLEWWLVSGWLSDKLQEHGEPVIEGENIWGRTTSGQAISIDGVIFDICEQLNMFE